LRPSLSSALATSWWRSMRASSCKVGSEAMHSVSVLTLGSEAMHCVSVLTLGAVYEQ
jgi:hypothetical protein